jgi:hypothetical protein
MPDGPPTPNNACVADYSNGLPIVIVERPDTQREVRRHIGCLTSGFVNLSAMNR